jgi:hypothetical protein
MSSYQFVKAYILDELFISYRQKIIESISKLEFKSSTSACNDFDFSQMCPENRIRASRSFWSDPKSQELTSRRRLGESSISNGPQDFLHQKDAYVSLLVNFKDYFSHLMKF